jgi:AP-3 complex subunit delta-1
MLFLAFFRMFEKTLTDVIKGIRANKQDEPKYIPACLDEIRVEIKRPDMDIKANALSKLIYVTSPVLKILASFHGI